MSGAIPADSENLSHAAISIKRNSELCIVHFLFCFDVLLIQQAWTVSPSLQILLRASVVIDQTQCLRAEAAGRCSFHLHFTHVAPSHYEEE